MNPDRMQAVLLKVHLKLLNLGMKNSQLSGKQILDKASVITGQPYKRGQYQKAVDDLQKLIDGELE
jgi:hypothetical protein